MLIEYEDADSIFNSVWVSNPDGKIVSATNFIVINTSAYFKSRSFLINGSSIDTYRGSSGYFTGSMSTYDGTTMSVTSGDYIRIRKVIGWK